MEIIETHPSCQIPINLFRDYLPEFGTFVEVGAFDGMTYGCTWGLAVKGWRGVYVEAHPDFALQCIKNHKNHPLIDTYAVACGKNNGQSELIIYGEVSTTKLDRWSREWGMNEQTPRIPVPVKTLDWVLDDAEIKEVDLLVVDVEGAEIDVLMGYRGRPKMAIIELHEGQGTRPDQKGYQTAWVDEYFSGYKKIYFDNINTVYVLTK